MAETYTAEDELDLVNSASSSSSSSSGGGGGNGDEEGKAKGSHEEESLTREEAAWQEAASAMATKIQAEFKEEAKRVADKVQRQQEGKESAMLEQEHEDENFLTVDEIKQLLESQMKSNAKTSNKTSSSSYGGRSYGSSSSSSSSFSRYDRGTADMSAAAVADPRVALKLGEWFLGRAKYIPVRLSYEERKHLRQCQALMRGHEYTQTVDGKKHKSAARRSHAKVKAIASVLTGMITCLNAEAGAKIARSKDFARYRKAIQTLFEIGRRYKIMNPDRMRGEYGKMLYLLQDCAQADLTEQLGFQVVVPVKTVYDILEEGGGLAVLQVGKKLFYFVCLDFVE